MDAAGAGVAAGRVPAECVLVRHGETTGNSAVRLYGCTDVPLSDHGRRQMACVRDALRHETFDRVVVSPLARSRESASIVAPGLEAVVEPGFTEIDFGLWEGWTFDEARARDPEGYAAWQRDGPRFRFPGGEERAAFHARVRDAAVRVFAAPCRTLAVLHKGVIKIVVAALLDAPLEAISALPVDLGGIHRLRRTNDGWLYTSRNEVAHLGTERTPDGTVRK
jgi:broad specificity phosphatase PhoE